MSGDGGRRLFYPGIFDMASQVQEFYEKRTRVQMGAEGPHGNTCQGSFESFAMNIACSCDWSWNRCGPYCHSQTIQQLHQDYVAGKLLGWQCILRPLIVETEGVMKEPGSLQCCFRRVIKPDLLFGSTKSASLPNRSSISLRLTSRSQEHSQSSSVWTLCRS